MAQSGVSEVLRPGLVANLHAMALSQCSIDYDSVRMTHHRLATPLAQEKSVGCERTFLAISAEDVLHRDLRLSEVLQRDH